VVPKTARPRAHASGSLKLLSYNSRKSKLLILLTILEISFIFKNLGKNLEKFQMRRHRIENFPEILLAILIYDWKFLVAPLN